MIRYTTRTASRECSAYPDGSVDCIICDLPYGTTACKWDSVIPFEPLWEQYKRVTKPNAAILLFGQEPFSSTLRVSNLKAFKYDWIWEKRFAGNFANAKIQPLKIHEIVSVFCFGKCPYNPQMTKRDEPIKAGGNNMNIDVYNKFDPKSEYEGKLYYEKFPESILHFNVRGEGRGLHPTVKPVDLIAYLIRTYSNEGDTVLDNCMGSGTTAIACIKEKRHFIGFELNKEYFDKATKRIKAEQSQLSLF